MNNGMLVEAEIWTVARTDKGNVATVGGSWMVPGDAVRDRDWQRIAALARDCVNLLA